MFPTWRLKIRDARRAMATGRWDEAAQLLQQSSLQEFWPAKKLASQLADQLLRRAGNHIAEGNSQAGWHDLQQATQLGGNDKTIDALRDAHFQRGIAMVRRCLQQGEPQLALEELDRLDKRQLNRLISRSYRLIARLLQRAKRQVSKGHLQDAANALHRAQQLVSNDKSLRTALVAKEKAVRGWARQLQSLEIQLHQELGQEDWTKVLVTAEAMLELASDHGAARQARQRAWHAVSVTTTLSYHPRGLSYHPRGFSTRETDRPEHRFTYARQGSTNMRSGKVAMADASMNQQQSGRRLVAWIDTVGGYLLCLGDEISLGQRSPQGAADIPFLADLSRRHALIRRDGESYVIIPTHSVRVDGVKLTGPVVLRDQALLQLGDMVRLRFRRPHTLSATALLTPESHHRIDPAVDAIVLMSDSCILGPQENSHIRCRHWPGDLVLVRRGDQVRAHTEMPLEVNGQPYNPHSCTIGIGRLENDVVGLSVEELK